MRTALKLALFGGGGWKTVTQPDAAFSWLPFTVQQKGRLFRPHPSWSIDALAPSGTKYYVSTTGSDANDGLSAGAPLRKIVTAIGKADVVEIELAPGDYGATNGFTSTKITKTLSVKCPSGRAVCGSWTEGLSWTLDDTNTYYVTLATTAKVLDKSILSGGYYSALTLRADVAAVKANPGSWHLDGSNVLWVHTADDRAPDADILAFTTAASRVVYWETSAKTFYGENIDFVGGYDGCVYGYAAANQSYMYFKDCTFRFCLNTNGLSTYGKHLSICVDCDSSKNYDDGFNYHFIDATHLPQAIEVNCTAAYNGVTSNTDNGTTMHDGGSKVCLMGEYYASVGRNEHSITNGTTVWHLGSIAHDSASATADCNFAVGSGGADAAKMWLDSCTSYGSVTDIEIAALATCYIRDFVGGGVYIGTPTAY